MSVRYSVLIVAVSGDRYILSTWCSICSPVRCCNNMVVTNFICPYVLTSRICSMPWLVMALVMVVARLVASQESGGSRQTRKSSIAVAWGALACSRSQLFKGIRIGSSSAAEELDLRQFFSKNTSSKMRCASRTFSSDISCNCQLLHTLHFTHPGK